MADFKKQLKRILGLISISVLLSGFTIGILTKEKNNPKAGSSQSPNWDYGFEARNNTSNLNIEEIEHQKIICSDLLEEDENTLVFKELSEAEVVECMFVGCGGIF